MAIVLTAVCDGCGLFIPPKIGEDFEDAKHKATKQKWLAARRSWALLLPDLAPSPRRRRRSARRARSPGRGATLACGAIRRMKNDDVMAAIAAIERWSATASRIREIAVDVANALDKTRTC